MVCRRFGSVPKACLRNLEAFDGVTVVLDSGAPLSRRSRMT